MTSAINKFHNNLDYVLDPQDHYPIFELTNQELVNALRNQYETTSTYIELVFKGELVCPWSDDAPSYPRYNYKPDFNGKFFRCILDFGLRMFIIYPSHVSFDILNVNGRDYHIIVNNSGIYTMSGDTLGICDPHGVSFVGTDVRSMQTVDRDDDEWRTDDLFGSTYNDIIIDETNDVFEPANYFDPSIFDDWE